MNKYRSEVSSILRGAGFIGLMIISLTVFFFLTKSAEMHSSSDSTQQNMVLRRLVFSTMTGTFSGPQLSINTSNADGTGVVNLTNFPPTGDPAWSPDGTKIVYIAYGVNDIFVMNADGSNQTNLSNSQGVTEANPSWSATGKIVYERNSQIWIMNADGSNQMQFAGITQSAPTDPVWSRDGTKIAFVSGGEIWKIDANGSNEQRVTTSASTDADPSWSHDGAKIVFSKGGSGIAVINADGTNETNLTNVAGDVNPSWSSDGSTIAFRRGTPQGGIYIMDVTGGNLVRIIADTQGPSPSIFSTYNEPSWQPVPTSSPHFVTVSGRITRNNVGLGGVVVTILGSTVPRTVTTDAVGNYQFSDLVPGGHFRITPSLLNHYFTPPYRIITAPNTNQIADFTATEVCVGSNCARNGLIAFVRSDDIFTMNPDGTNQTNITNNAAADLTPSYSHDGTKIAFSSNRDGNNEIYKMNSDGSSPIRLTNNSASDITPNYSYDSASIVFVSNRDGNQEIYKMNADGSNQVRLTNDAGTDTLPAFSPDGQKIIFITTRLGNGTRLFTMNADGSNQQVISNVAGSSFYNRPSYSPDGSKIIFVYGDDVTTQNIWTMNADGTNRALAGFGRSSPSYSPDGTKVVHNCCFSPNQNANGIWVSNVGGSLGTQLTGAQFDDFPDWQPILTQRRVQFDYDGDGRADISVFRPSDTVWYMLRSSAGFTAVQWGLASDVLVPDDYDGDLKTDIAVWRPSNGNYYAINTFNNTMRQDNLGLAGDIPTGGDYDGDSRADWAVYRPGSQGVFYYRATAGNPNQNITFIPWGIGGDKPVAGDYDGDGRTDAAVFRPSNGTWYVRKSSDGQMLASNFGLADDTLVPADYDGDGKTDFAVFRPSTGTWYILRSLQGFTAFQYGISGDTPAPADYDGDGRADAAIFRNGTWYVLKSQSGATEITNFGMSGDIPIPAAYVR